jgi:hypothetical protein
MSFKMAGLQELGSASGGEKWRRLKAWPRFIPDKTNKPCHKIKNAGTLLYYLTSVETAPFSRSCNPPT